MAWTLLSRLAPTARAASTLALLVVAAALASCGNGHHGTSPLPASAQYANRCATPRAGIDPLSGAAYPDRQGTVDDEKTWVRSWIDELYLWYREVPDVDPAAYVKDLSVGQQQRVEIIKALYRQADILILDEPTAVLTPQETDELIEIMATLTPVYDLVTAERPNSRTGENQATVVVTQGGQMYTSLVVTKGPSGPTSFSIFWLVPNQTYTVEVQIGGSTVYSQTVAGSSLPAGAVFALNNGNPI